MASDEWKYWIFTAEKMLTDHTLHVTRFLHYQQSLIDINVITHLPVQLSWLISGNKEIIFGLNTILIHTTGFWGISLCFQCFSFHFFYWYQPDEDMSDPILFQGWTVGSNDCVRCFNCNGSTRWYFFGIDLLSSFEFSILLKIRDGW